MDDNEAFARQCLTLAHDFRADVTYSAPVYEDITARNAFADFHFPIRKFDHSSILYYRDPLLRDANLAGNSGVLFEMPQLAVDRNEVLGANQLH